jgi:glycosyltransferase involved in cell wall biosynthesis
MRRSMEKHTQKKPGVLFTMRYPDDTGYVWNYIASVRDRASAYLQDHAVPYMAFPRLTGQPSYPLQHLRAVELDCYDYSPSGREAIARFIRDNNIKVMVFMSALPQTIGMRLLRRLGVRTVNTEDDGFDPLRRDPLVKRGLKFLMRRVLRLQQHDLHLANSRSQEAFLLDYARLPPDRVCLMTNSVDTSHFCPGDRGAARRITGLDPDRFWIIAVSQARPEKRVDELIRMMQRLLAARPEARLGFVYVGDGPIATQWKALATELGVQDAIVFAGRQNDVLPYYRSANLMVHAAHTESFGLAIVEAMACGIPVVASAASGPCETIIDGHTGALVPIQDMEAFGHAVLRYIDNVEMTKNHSENARAHVVASYNVMRHSKEFANHIAQFL